MKQGDRVIDELHERIAKKVAVEIAESLVLRVREFPDVVYSKEANQKTQAPIRMKFIPPPQSMEYEKERRAAAGLQSNEEAKTTDVTSSEKPNNEGVITPPENPDNEVATTTPLNTKVIGKNDT